MNKSWTLSHHHRFFLGVLIALAFLAQSIIPVGYMPKFQRGKIFEITICHGDAIAKVVVDEHMRPVENTDNSKEKSGQLDSHSQFCPYAYVSSKTIGPEVVGYLYTENLIYVRLLKQDTQTVFSRFIDPPYEGRAPPKPLA